MFIRRGDPMGRPYYIVNNQNGKNGTNPMIA